MDFDAALLERVAQRFRRDMWDSVVPDAIYESGIELVRFGPVQATAFTELPEAPMLNLIQGAAEPGAVAGGHLARAVEWMRCREVDYRIFVADSRPGSEEAESWLDSRGYECGDGWTAFVRDASAPPEYRNPGVTVWPLGDRAFDGEGLSSLLARTMGLPLTAETLFYSLPQRPRWRCYTASLTPDEVLVGTASMMMHEGVAAFGPGVTMELARGRGVGSSLLHRRLLDAIDAGCHTMFAEAWDTGPDQQSTVGRNLMRAGFQPAYTVRTWQRPALRPAVTPRFIDTD